MLWLTAPQRPLPLLTCVFDLEKTGFLADCPFRFDEDGLVCSMFSEFSLSSQVEFSNQNSEPTTQRNKNTEQSMSGTEDWDIQGAALNIKPLWEHSKIDNIWKRDGFPVETTRATFSNKELIVSLPDSMALGYFVAFSALKFDRDR